ncbi:MAG TPA: anhydro-N-acetylmuramic acid kinase [Gammaproteobacteria bacterium]|jgi:anhydro-N-acetylmuramic acid kinase|nr:anhydro-N-acetylmuramic acid kinase [Arenicellales bacterium]HCY13136.1 anhydro-N-acetylmuramic acid kinase [Gammaproteobacteria bacterium]|tara:strand:- start:2123 stop:3205 length:1083 start_codon:yes stop_codon:yes gene_type:complete
MGEIFVGLMSGTSADAIDAAAIEIDETGIRLLHTCSQPLTQNLRQHIHEVTAGDNDRLEHVCSLDLALGVAFADAALELIAGLDRPPRAIGCHGQTVRHCPERQFTVQLGSGAVLAAKTGITTVTDFRSGDLALGGQGAPLAPAFHRAVFSSATEERTIINIGGIANITHLSASGKVLGFDTGPGNTLLDHWYRRHCSGPFDSDGTWAASGALNTPLLEKLLADGYFQAPPPKSTGLEHFNLDWLQTHLDGNEAAPDVQTTLLALTTGSIANAVHSHAPQAAALYLCGGGALNGELVRQLQAHLGEVPIRTTLALGIAPQWVEACAFAWLAHQRLCGQTGNIPAVTEAIRPAVLGAVYLP